MPDLDFADCGINAQVDDRQNNRGVDSSLGVVSLISDEEREEEVTLLQEKANKADISKKSKGLHIIFLQKNCIPDQTGPETGFVGKECKK